MRIFWHSCEFGRDEWWCNECFKSVQVWKVNFVSHMCAGKLQKKLPCLPGKTAGRLPFSPNFHETAIKIVFKVYGKDLFQSMAAQKERRKSLIPCRPKNWAKSRRDQIENLGSAAPWPILTFASRWTNRVGASAQNVKGKLGLFPLDPIGRHRGQNFPSRIDPDFPSSDEKKSFPIAPHFFPGAPYCILHPFAAISGRHGQLTRSLQCTYLRHIFPQIYLVIPYLRLDVCRGVFLLQFSLFIRGWFGFPIPPTHFLLSRYTQHKESEDVDRYV